jgi:mono/diheme cytochrome c family protein
MKRQTTLPLFMAILLLTGGIFLASCSGSSQSSPAVDESSAPLTGEELMLQRCTVCHTETRIVEKSADLEGWTTTVDRMMTKGARLDEAERQTLIDYLTQTYP